MSQDSVVGQNGHRAPFEYPLSFVGPTQAVSGAAAPTEPAFAPNGFSPGSPQPATPNALVQQVPGAASSDGGVLTAPAPVDPTPVVSASVAQPVQSGALVPAPAEPPNFERAMRREGFQRPIGPDEPGSEVTFPLRKAKELGFYMTVLAAGTGQVLFFEQVFGGGAVGWTAAGFIAAFAEVAMIGSGDSALRHKVEGAKNWALLLFVSGAIAVAAAAMQVAHWWGSSVALALTFGVASIAGWAVHIVSGVISANSYLLKKARWDAELGRRRGRWEQREQAAYDRQLADEEDARTAARRGRREAEELTASLAPAAVRSMPKKRASTGQGLKLDAATARRWSDDNGRPGPAAVIEHFTGLGYDSPVRSTVRRWLNGTK